MKTQTLKNTLSIVAIALAFTAIFQACKKDGKSSKTKSAKEFAAAYGPQNQFMQIDPTKSNSFILKGGTKITIPANAFRKNGGTVTGSVLITMREYLKRSAVIFGGTNTNHISGAPLESDGFIYLNASQNGFNLDQALANTIAIAIPTTNTRGTQIWEGVEKVDNADQMAWQAPVQNANGVGIKRESGAVDNFYNFNMGNLGWINCDVFYAYTEPKTTVKVTVTNNPGTLATFMGFTGETFIFFCAKGSNVAAQLYTPDGANAVKSYDNMMPIGVQGKYLSFSIKDGKFYLAQQETTITANQAITLNLVETTEAQVQQAIDALNNY